MTLGGHVLTPPSIPFLPPSLAAPGLPREIYVVIGKLPPVSWLQGMEQVTQAKPIHRHPAVIGSGVGI